MIMYDNIIEFALFMLVMLVFTGGLVLIGLVAAYIDNKYLSK